MSSMIESPTADTGPGVGATGAVDVADEPLVDVASADVAVADEEVDAATEARPVDGADQGAAPLTRLVAPLGVPGAEGWADPERCARASPSRASSNATRAAPMILSVRQMADIRLSVPCSTGRRAPLGRRSTGPGVSEAGNR